MQFVNHTPFPALAFEGVDQIEQRFHVVALRQTLTWNADGTLVFVDEQTPLCETDECFEPDAQDQSQDQDQGAREVRQESDLCQYKPRCDVIVHATAHAPRGPKGTAKPPKQFNVRLRVKRPDAPAPLPPEPRGLNPWMSPAPEQMRAWKEAVERARRSPLAGERLIDKTLLVTGERHFERPTGLLSLLSWELRDPRPTPTVPLRLARAFGGQCRIDAGSPVADKVPKKHRLPSTAEITTAATAEPAPEADAAQRPIAADALAANPAGRGFLPDWYLKASGTTRLAAPQIEHPKRPITLALFDRARAGDLDPQRAAELVAGLGPRPKSHPERAARVGTIDQAFISGPAALPADFDFAVWNAAWPDQQVDELVGDETLELTNLCAADSLGAARDDEGNAVLSLTLPGHLPFVLVRLEDGAIGELAARLDTVMLEVEERRICLVWRATLAKQPAVRVLEARMLDRQAVQALLNPAPEQPATLQPAPPAQPTQRLAHG